MNKEVKRVGSTDGHRIKLNGWFAPPWSWVIAIGRFLTWDADAAEPDSLS
jgi:hypothetical protein